MRILICCNAYPPNFLGGAELVAHRQGRALAELGHEVRVFAGDRDSNAAGHEPRAEDYEGLCVYRVGLAPEDYRPEFARFTHPRVEEHFQRLLADYRPRIVHFHNLVGLSVGIIRIAREFGAVTVLTLHDYWGFCFKNTLMKTEGVVCTDFSACSACQAGIIDAGGRHVPVRLRQDHYGLLMQDIDVFVSPSRYLAETYARAGFPEARLRVLRNGIDTARFASVSRISTADRVRFTFIGTFGRHKGVHVLLAALPLLRNKDRFEVNLVGEGGQLPEYLRQLRQNGCEERVRFWGKLDNRQVVDVLRETDVFVLPSIWPENQPVSITEAMASGIAVIASNLGGMPELVEHGRTGLLFEAGNPEDLAEKMDELIAAPGKIIAFGEAGRERMRDNVFSTRARRLLDLYAECAAQPLASVSDARPLLVCIGMTELCQQALEWLPRYHQGAMPRIVMADWLTESRIAHAAILWVIGQTDQWAALALAEKFALPLLVPETEALLAAQCRLRNCGLYYADAHEAAACIGYLLNHESARKSLAANAGRPADEKRFGEQTF